MTGRRLAIYLPAIVLISTLLLRTAGFVGDLALDMVFLACMALTGARMLASTALPWQIWGGLLAAGLVALVALRLQFTGLRYMPYAILAPANLGLSYAFAYGLFGDRVPILIRLVDIMGQKDAEDPAFRRFIARQCLLWSVATLVTAAMAVACMVSSGAREIVVPALMVFVAAQVAHFALSHHYASIRYGRPETWVDTLKAMSRPETWRGLTA